jgi:two-component system cell cycle response regulator
MNGEHAHHLRSQDTSQDTTPAPHVDVDGSTGDAARAETARATPTDPALAVAANGTSAGGLDAVEDDDALVDAETGLFTEGYFKVAVEMRIAAARRRLRPVAVVLLDVVREVGSSDQRPGVPTSVSRSIRETLREADTASRLDDGRYALVLEDTPESGAIWTVERLRSRLVEAEPDHTVWAGIACYPAHAFDTAEILSQAEAALELAREWRQDRIEVATAD